MPWLPEHKRSRTEKEDAPAAQYSQYLAVGPSRRSAEARALSQYPLVEFWAIGQAMHAGAQRSRNWAARRLAHVACPAAADPSPVGPPPSEHKVCMPCCQSYAGVYASCFYACNGPNVCIPKGAVHTHNVHTHCSHWRLAADSTALRVRPVQRCTV